MPYQISFDDADDAPHDLRSILTSAESIQLDVV